MSKHAGDDRLSEFETRLDRLKEEAARAAVSQAGRRQSGYSMAFGIAADMVGGVVGGAGIGWLVDRWLNSAPLGLIAFFFLGAGAGMWNVYRTVRSYDMSFGFSRPPTPGAANRGGPGTPGAGREKESGDQRGQSTPSVRSAADHSDPYRRR